MGEKTPRGSLVTCGRNWEKKKYVGEVPDSLMCSLPYRLPLLFALLSKERVGWRSFSPLSSFVIAGKPRQAEEEG